jgi:hypothetical protein
MKKTKVFSYGLFLLVALSVADSKLPKGWIKWGSEPDRYDMYMEKGTGFEGKNCATIKSNVHWVHGFGTLMQNCKPDNYISKRIRFSGYVKSKKAGWAGLWLRVDGIGASTLSFDNMQDRPIKGTADWKKYEVVLDVPTGATNIAFGALLAGTGQIWLDNISLEIVSDSVKCTGSVNNRKVNDEPTNLNFEE